MSRRSGSIVDRSPLPDLRRCRQRRCLPDRRRVLRVTAVFNGRGIKLSVIARILRDEMAQRDNGIIGAENVCAASLADDVAASGKMTPNTAKRRIYSILNPEYTTRNGKRITQQVVEFDTADKILTALDLNYLWHTDAE